MKRKRPIRAFFTAGFLILLTNFCKKNDPVPSSNNGGSSAAVVCAEGSFQSKSANGVIELTKTEYDANGNISKKLFSDKSGNIDPKQYENYIYYASKFVRIEAKILATNEDGSSYILPITIDFEYSDTNISRKIVNYLFDSSFINTSDYKFIYDASGNLTQKITYLLYTESDTSAQNKVVFSGYVNGRPGKKSYYTYFGSSYPLKKEYFYEYDDNMNRIKTSYKEYDTNGNLIYSFVLNESTFDPKILASTSFDHIADNDNPNPKTKDRDKNLKLTSKNYGFLSCNSLAPQEVLVELIANVKTNANGCISSYDLTKITTAAFNCISSITTSTVTVGDK